jgi:hypothetical protein
MKSVNLIVLALVAISLLLVLPAWSQGGNPPASTKESGATSGHGMTPVEQGGKSTAVSVEEELRKLETDRAAAVVKADITTLEAQTADDYTLINANGQVMDKKQTLDAIKTGQSQAHIQRAFRFESARVWRRRGDHWRVRCQRNAFRNRGERTSHVHPGVRQEKRSLAVRRVSADPRLEALRRSLAKSFNPRPYSSPRAIGILRL